MLAVVSPTLAGLIVILIVGLAGTCYLMFLILTLDLKDVGLSVLEEDYDRKGCAYFVCRGH